MDAVYGLSVAVNVPRAGFKADEVILSVEHNDNGATLSISRGSYTESQDVEVAGTHAEVRTALDEMIAALQRLRAGL